MQIYELTENKSLELDEANPLAAVTGAVGSAVAGAKNIGTAIASPFRNAGAAYSQATTSAKLNAWTDKAYRAWEGYVAKRLLPMDQAQKAAYVNGQDGRMKQDLLSFVQKNFFSNLDINNITNGQEVMSVIDSMVAPATAPATAMAQAPNFGKSGYASQTTNAPTRIPATSGPMPTNMVTPGKSPTPAATPAAKKPTVTSGGPTPAEREKLAARVKAASEPISEAVNKQGFLKLAQLAATAQQPVGQSRTRTRAAAPAGTRPTASIGSIIQQAGINSAALQTLGQSAIAALSNNNDSAESTGNPAADALLKSLGFKLV